MKRLEKQFGSIDELDASKSHSTPPNANKRKKVKEGEAEDEIGDVGHPSKKAKLKAEEHKVKEASGDDSVEKEVTKEDAALLSTLKANQDVEPPRMKKRKLSSPLSTKPDFSASKKGIQESSADTSNKVKKPSAEEGNAIVDPVPAINDSDDENDNSEDSFQQHFVARDAEELSQFAKSTSGKKKAPAILLDGTIRRSWTPASRNSKDPFQVQQARDLHLKQRLASNGSHLLQSLNSVQKDLVGAIYSYCDVLAAIRTVQNATALRNICMLHALNHVYKTRDLVLKNNAKLSQIEGDGPGEIRDQGFTRPKILVVVPTKQSCVRIVESIVALSEPQQQENKARFLEQFSLDDDDEWREKPDDFQELFGGNHGEDFRIGLKFTRKTIKFFSGFYNSDIIIASPLGLRRTVEGSGKQEEGTQKAPDSDFLSSIEIAVVDNASALQMQNWEHVDFVFGKLNSLPREAHGCDFSRVRHWYLDGNAKYLRQTIIMSAYQTPEINNLAGEHLLNIAGRVQYTPVYEGAMTEVAKSLPFTTHQTLIRFEAASAATDAAARLAMFGSSILPQLLRSGESLQGVLIFAPTYLDFSSLRNNLSGTLEKTAVSFGNISEYTPVKDVNRTRSHFMNGRRPGLGFGSSMKAAMHRTQRASVSPTEVCGECCPFFRFGIMHEGMSREDIPELCRLWVRSTINSASQGALLKVQLARMTWEVPQSPRTPKATGGRSLEEIVVRRHVHNVSVRKNRAVGAVCIRGSAPFRSGTLAEQLPAWAGRGARQKLKGSFRRTAGTLVTLHKTSAETVHWLLEQLDPMEGIEKTGRAYEWMETTLAREGQEDVDMIEGPFIPSSQAPQQEASSHGSRASCVMDIDINLGLPTPPPTPAAPDSRSVSETVSRTVVRPQQVLPAVVETAPCIETQPTASLAATSLQKATPAPPAVRPRPVPRDQHAAAPVLINMIPSQQGTPVVVSTGSEAPFLASKRRAIAQAPATVEGLARRLQPVPRPQHAAAHVVFNMVTPPATPVAVAPPPGIPVSVPRGSAQAPSGPAAEGAPRRASGGANSTAADDDEKKDEDGRRLCSRPSKRARPASPSVPGTVVGTVAANLDLHRPACPSPLRAVSSVTPATTTTAASSSPSPSSSNSTSTPIPLHSTSAAIKPRGAGSAVRPRPNRPATTAASSSTTSPPSLLTPAMTSSATRSAPKPGVPTVEDRWRETGDDPEEAAAWIPIQH
ncbi:hypothetical protein DV737_g235, partial [Chaetothyriales sp. CBS 132003]